MLHKADFTSGDEEGQGSRAHPSRPPPKDTRPMFFASGSETHASLQHIAAVMQNTRDSLLQCQKELQRQQEAYRVVCDRLTEAESSLYKSQREAADLRSRLDAISLDNDTLRRSQDAEDLGKEKATGTSEGKLERLFLLVDFIRDVCEVAIGRKPPSLLEKWVGDELTTLCLTGVTPM